MIDFDEELRKLRGGPPRRLGVLPRPQATPQIDFAQELTQLRGASRPRPQLTTAGRYFTGGPLEKAFDILRTGEYAVGGVLSRQPGESFGGAVRRGIQTRRESGREFAVQFQRLGAPDSFVTDAAAFLASVVVDPINLIGTGIAGKGLRAIGAPGVARAVESVGLAIARPIQRGAGQALQAVGERVPRVGEALRAAEGRRLLEPIVEEQVKREARGVEQVVNLGQRIRRDAQRLTRRPKDAQRLDQALGLYFDAGADTMVAHLALGGDLRTARAAGLADQRQFLQSADAGTQAFIQRWAPILRQEDQRFAEQLVQRKMLSPETVAKWEGFHLRRIYQKFEDPHAFVDFLNKTDPVEAQRLLGKMERGIPIARSGRPLPTGLMQQRKFLTEVERTGLGEIRQASSRFVSGGTMAERALARGDAYAKVAREFAVGEDTVRRFGEQAFRQMPQTAGWGELAGQWLPKQIADPLLRLQRKPEGIEKFIEQTTGWFKFAKVILNPATHFRNMRTNAALAHNQIGLGALNPVTWTRAVKEVATNGPIFQEAKSVSSAFIDTFTNSEIRNFITDGSERGVIAAFRRFGGGAARLYQTEEQVGKMAVYLSLRNKGVESAAAAKAAELALFNYRKVPPLIADMRRIGIYPFITFPYKVATETIPQIIRRPGRASQQVKFIGLGTAPLTEEERKSLPDYMRTGGYVKLPFNVNGKPVLFQLSYELPYGDISETGTPATAILNIFRQWQEGTIDVSEALRQMMPTFPPAAQIAAELLLNRSAFTGRDIVPEGETNKEKAKLLAYHAGRFISPSIVSKTAFPGGELRRSIEGVLPGGATGISPSGAPALPLPQAAASTVFGLKTVPLDVTREKRFRALEFRRALSDNESRLRSVIRNQSLDPDAKQRQRQELLRQRQAIIRRYRETGSAK